MLFRSVYGGFQQSKDVAFLDTTGKGFFVGVTQSIDSAASVLYGQYSHLSVDGLGATAICGGSCQNEQSWIMGLKVSF